MRYRHRSLIILALLILVMLAGVADAVENETAVVHGISKLFVRRGPGMEFPPFASLSEGSVVEIKGIEHEWARITTTSGQVGYVPRKYLETGRGETAPTSTVAATRKPTSTAVETRKPTRTPANQRPTLSPTLPPPTATERIIAIAERTATIADVSPSPTAAVVDPTETAIPASVRHRVNEGGGGEQAIQNELHELRLAVERLQRRLDEYPGMPNSALPPVSTTETSTSISGGAVLLFIAGLVFGSILGSSYTRQQERGRRSRIRF